jgi:chemotaxis protein CheD
MGSATSQTGMVFLQPGELFTSEKPARVKTILGSCIAITIRDRRLGLAAMAHCLLPEAGTPARAIPRREALRFVDTTIELMLRFLTQRGADCQDLEVKLFGGADALSRTRDRSAFAVGRRNVETALAVLATYGLKAAASGVGGRRGRVIEFDTRTGDVLVKQLPRTAVDWEEL